MDVLAPLTSVAAVLTGYQGEWWAQGFLFAPLPNVPSTATLDPVDKNRVKRTLG